MSETTMLAVSHREKGSGFGVAEWLCLAATPAFAAMALLTGLLESGPNEILCSATQGAFPFSGMASMYLLMSVFHSAPWLKLVFGRTGKPGRD